MKPNKEDVKLASALAVMGVLNQAIEIAVSPAVLVLKVGAKVQDVVHMISANLARQMVAGGRLKTNEEAMARMAIALSPDATAQEAAEAVIALHQARKASAQEKEKFAKIAKELQDAGLVRPKSRRTIFTTEGK
jgi:hypothetical protein